MAPDWLDIMCARLRTSGYSAGIRHVRHMCQTSLGTDSAQIAANAGSLLDAIEKREWDLITFHIPRPAPIGGSNPEKTDRHGWSRQYDRCRTSSKRREEIPSLRQVSGEDDLILRTAYIEGLSDAFYEELLKLVPGRSKSDYEPGFIRNNLP